MQASWLMESYSIWVIQTLPEILTQTELVSKGIDLPVPSFCMKDSEPHLSALPALCSINLRLEERGPQELYIRFLSQQCLKKERHHGSVLGEGKLSQKILAKDHMGQFSAHPLRLGVKSASLKHWSSWGWRHIDRSMFWRQKLYFLSLLIASENRRNMFMKTPWKVRGNNNMSINQEPV